MSKSAIFDGKPVNIPKFKDNQPAHKVETTAGATRPGGHEQRGRPRTLGHDDGDSERRDPGSTQVVLPRFNRVAG